MKILSAFFIFTTTLLFSQNQRFIYEYKFTKDSTKISESQTEMMYLDISKKGSKFYSVDKYKADSTLDARNKNNPHNPDFSGIKFGQVNSIVEKSYPDFKISFFDYLDTNDYVVTDKREMQWKILPDKEKIGEMNVQKATTTIYGRKWNAWFASDIPLQDGPYKFRGLPGMIVKISDPGNTHIFELKGIKNLTEQEVWISENDKKRFQPLIALDDAKYKKVYVESRENPTKGMRQMLASGTKVIITDHNGKEIDIEEHLRERERNQKEENKRNNNILELDLIK